MLVRNAPQKPIKGQYLLEKRKQHRALKRHEQKEMQAAKARDGQQCRWPGCKLDLPIDACHRRDLHRGAGGNKSGDRTQRKFVIALCRYHHGLYDTRVNSIEPHFCSTYFDGPCDFYEPDPETGKLQHIATEKRIGVSISVGA